jgi:sugar lactone lactonase YvrE
VNLDFPATAGPADDAQTGASIVGLAVDAFDNLLFIDEDNSVVRRIAPDGTITTIAPVWYAAGDLAVGPEGNLYFAGLGRVFVMGMNADGLPVDDSDDGTAEVSPGADPWAGEEPGTVLTVAGESFDAADDLTVAADGSVYVVNAADKNQLMAVAPTGDVTAIAGGDGEQYPFDRRMTAVEAGKDGSIYLAAGDAVARIYPDDTTSVVAGGDNLRWKPYEGQLASSADLSDDIQLTSAPDGRIYIADSWGGRLCELNTDGTFAIVAEDILSDPDGFLGRIAADGDHNVYLADTTGQQVLKIDSTGSVRRFAGLGEQASATDDDGDGERADEAPLWGPTDVAVHPDGTVYISTGQGIRTVDDEGIIDTVAEFDNTDDSRAAPNTLAFDAHGNLYFSDRPGGQVGVLVRPAEISDPFPWSIMWVSAAAFVVLAGAAVVVIRRRRNRLSPV